MPQSENVQHRIRISIAHSTPVHPRERGEHIDAPGLRVNYRLDRKIIATAQRLGQIRLPPHHLDVV